MKEMGWTYQEYQDQPTWIIDQVTAFIEAERSALSEGNEHGGN